MKGDPKLIKKLNQLLMEELTAINQYMVHSEMCANWGYEALHKDIEARARVEMKHAEKLIARILFLDAKPVVSDLGPIHIGQDVPQQFHNDLAAEMDAVKHYNEAIALAVSVADNATKDMLEEILEDEDDHVDDLEEKLDQLAQMGVQMYLSTQVKE